MFREAESLDELIPVEGVGWDHDHGASSFLPPHVFSLLRSSHAVVTQQLAALPPGTPVATAAARIAPLEKLSESRGYHEEHPGKSPRVGIDKVLHKLHLDGKNTTIVPEPAPFPPPKPGMRLSPEQADEVAMCGDWRGPPPSPLFLNIYAQVLLTLTDDPLRGAVSPPLLGSNGIVPVSIISVVPDITHHIADLVVNASVEILLSSPRWEGGAARVLTDALRELSRRVVAARRAPVVVKVMIGAPTNQDIVGSELGAFALPASAELPGVNLQVRRGPCASVAVIDRQIAVLTTAAVHDGSGLEMMAQYEGPVVQSLYDVALLAWWGPMVPDLPLLRSPPQHPAIGEAGQYRWPAPNLAGIGVRSVPKLTNGMPGPGIHGPQRNETNWDRTYDVGAAAEAEHVNVLSDPAALNRHLNTGIPVEATDVRRGQAFKPVVLLPPHDPVPMAIVNRPHTTNGTDPLTQALLAAARFAERSIFIQVPSFRYKPAVEAILEAIRRGVQVEIYVTLHLDHSHAEDGMYFANTAEAARYMLQAVGDERLRIAWYTGRDQSEPRPERMAHIAIMLVDEQVALQGSGPDGTGPSVNLLIDGGEVCRIWGGALEANQNTGAYGQVEQ
ncbi:hypothetical protein CspHIS471_0500150 [Cutaneotrichosporon sp. HIS471]|nr:hypothetical protein CspHIS471_0500150 [Cutaneotrichosporon sp. HIS471]